LARIRVAETRFRDTTEDVLIRADLPSDRGTAVA